MSRIGFLAAMSFLGGGITVLKEELIDNKCQFSDVPTIAKNFARGAAVGGGLTLMAILVDLFTED